MNSFLTIKIILLFYFYVEVKDHAVGILDLKSEGLFHALAIQSGSCYFLKQEPFQCFTYVMPLNLHNVLL